MTDAPAEFWTELERNKPAKARFDALSRQEQQRILDQAQALDASQMRALVGNIRA